MANTITEKVFDKMDYILDHKLSGGSAQERESVLESCLQYCALLGTSTAIKFSWDDEKKSDFRETLSIGNYVGEGNSISVVPTFDGALDVALAEYKTEENSMGRSM